jgi:hypothetical protein
MSTINKISEGNRFDQKQILKTKYQNHQINKLVYCFNILFLFLVNVKSLNIFYLEL